MFAPFTETEFSVFCLLYFLEWAVKGKALPQIRPFDGSTAFDGD
jgi:hypothetical protein